GITRIPSGGWNHLLLVFLTGGWIVWCLRYGFSRTKPEFSQGVSGLLAGIVLVDALAVPASDPIHWGIFAGLFALALLLQRVIPAT
ncbi:MAG TPA: hypothetical protein VNZ22_02580, partial [Bacillota bacterium]|nr:hypothetical protein [Bacillota bacterium]